MHGMAASHVVKPAGTKPRSGQGDVGARKRPGRANDINGPAWSSCSLPDIGPSFAQRIIGNAAEPFESVEDLAACRAQGENIGELATLVTVGQSRTWPNRGKRN